jgi:hypothetical protein
MKPFHFFSIQLFSFSEFIIFKSVPFFSIRMSGVFIKTIQTHTVTLIYISFQCAITQCYWKDLFLCKLLCLILVSISLNEFDIERKFSNHSDAKCLYFAHFIFNHQFNIQIDLKWHNLLDNVSQIWLFILITFEKKRVNGPMKEKELHWLIIVR